MSFGTFLTRARLIVSSTTITCISTDIQRQSRIRVSLKFARVRFESRAAARKRKRIPRRVQEKVRQQRNDRGVEGPSSTLVCEVDLAAVLRQRDRERALRAVYFLHRRRGTCSSCSPILFPLNGTLFNRASINSGRRGGSGLEKHGRRAQDGPLEATPGAHRRSSKPRG